MGIDKSFTRGIGIMVASIRPNLIFKISHLVIELMMFITYLINICDSSGCRFVLCSICIALAFQIASILVHKIPGNCPDGECGRTVCPKSAGKYEGGEIVVIIACFAFILAGAIMTLMLSLDDRTNKAAVVLTVQFWIDTALYIGDLLFNVITLCNNLDKQKKKQNNIVQNAQTGNQNIVVSNLTEKKETGEK